MNPTAQTINDFIASLGQQAATWYNAIAYKQPVVPVAATPAEVALQQAQIQQQQQLLLGQQSAGLAGILANPLVIIIALVLVIALVVLR